MLLNNCWTSKDTGFLKASADLTKVKVCVWFTFLGRKRSKERFSSFFWPRIPSISTCFFLLLCDLQQKKLIFQGCSYMASVCRWLFQRMKTGYVINASSLSVLMFCLLINFSFSLIMYVTQHRPKIFCSSTFTIHFYYMHHFHT